MNDVLKYNYVVFNTFDNKYSVDNDGYYTICLRDLEKVEGVEVVNLPLSHKSLFLRALCNIHTSHRANRYFKIPFQEIWYPYFARIKFNNNKPICFIFIGRLPLEYIQYLKKSYKNSKCILLYRDLRSVTARLYPNHVDNSIFDYQMSIDRQECINYGMVYFDEFESKIEVPVSDNYPESDVFFAGKAKDRLDRLMQAYHIFTNAGLKCKFYLMNVEKKDQIALPGIQYSNSLMPYTEMLYHTVNSRCVLEINQKEAVGYTSRFLEAVMFNKRLITDNQDVIKSSFYNPENILCIHSMDEIVPSFVTCKKNVDYHYNNEFSPINLIHQIDNLLVNKINQ